MIAFLFLLALTAFVLAWHASDRADAFERENARLLGELHHLHAVRAYDTANVVEYVPASMREVKADRWAPL